MTGPGSVAFEELHTADLIVDAVYEGGHQGHAGDDPLARLLPCGNQGGFRFAGSRLNHDYRMALLYTSGEDTDWPDFLDEETGIFTYFGDNKRPGKGLHETPRGGNELLRFSFDALHGAPPDRGVIPPFFVFTKAGRGRAVRFGGLAVPGSKDVAASGDLVAVWRTAAGQRFQNYRSVFTVLDVDAVPRSWIHELAVGEHLGPSCPQTYRDWVDKGLYRPLESPRTLEHREKDAQLPESSGDRALVQAVHEFFKEDPHRFESCAIELWKMLAKEAVTDVAATRPTVDGGRDAVGRYSIGPSGDRIHLDFALEAKCYSLSSGAGVRDTARLVSRLRHRQFGVFVTTSFVGRQAYRELREDQHPVVVICARDIAGILKAHGMATKAAVNGWLEAEFA